MMLFSPARLEQALRRWKQEKESSHLETEKYIKMRTTSATLVEQLDRASSEVIRLADRLGQYDNLPLPVILSELLVFTFLPNLPPPSPSPPLHYISISLIPILIIPCIS